MQFSGVHHVSINVTDAAESTRFYVDVLGMRLRDDRPEFPFAGAWLQVGEQQVHLLEPPKGQHFALQVDDIHAARVELDRHGVTVSEPSELDGICLQSFFTDPTGNLIELNQPI